MTYYRNKQTYLLLVLFFLPLFSAVMFFFLLSSPTLAGDHIDPIPAGTTGIGSGNSTGVGSGGSTGVGSGGRTGIGSGRSTGIGSGPIKNPLSFGSLQELFARILQFLVALATPFIVLMIMYSGFKFVTARGNTEQIQQAQRMFMWTIIGGLLILGAAIIARVIEGTVKDITLLTVFLT